MDAISRETVFRFEAFRLDRRSGLSRLNQSEQWEPVTLGSRALDILTALVERRGDLVTKQMLIDAAWPATVIEDSNLTVQISTLRRVLDDGRTGSSCIQTVIGRGYRFVTAVVQFEVQARESEAPAAEVEPSIPDFVTDNTAPRRQPVIWGILAAAVVLVVGGVHVLHNTTDLRPAAYSAEDRRQSVVVLPFENSSSDPTQGGVAAGITRDVTAEGIAQKSFAPFAPADITAAYQGKRFDPRAIGHAHNLHFVLTGNAHRQDGRLIVAAILYQTEDGRPVWSRRYDTPDGPDAWNLVVQSIISNVGQATIDAEAALALREHPDSLDKRDLVLAAGAGSWSQLSKEKYLERIAFADRALGLDPDYVPALQIAGRVRAYLVLGGYSSNPETDLTLAAKQIDRALLLAPDNYPVLRAKATVLRAQGELHASAALFRRVIELQPARSTSYKDLGRVLLPLGYFDEALENFFTAKRLNLGFGPVQVDDMNLAIALVANGRFPEAIASARQAIAEFSSGSGRDAELPWLALIAAESQNGQDEDARADLRSFLGAPRVFCSLAVFKRSLIWAASPNLLEGLRHAGMPRE